MANFVWSIINLLVLWFIGWPVGGFCAMIYIFISPFGACIDGEFLQQEKIFKQLLGCDKINDLLHQGVEWPRKLGRAIKNGDAGFGC